MTYQWFNSNFKTSPNLGCGQIGKVLEKGAKSVVLASHLGRPDGSVVEK